MSIELKNVTYTYSPGTAYEIHALKDINLSIPDGQFIGIIGHTGSGKSTLIQHFNALIRPTSGTITYNGEDIWGEKYDRRALRSEVGLVFQYPEHQLFENDVLSDVCFGPMNQGLSREEAEIEAKKALQHVGFKEKNFSKSPFELSGGQKKRVAIAGVLAMNPKILILDEPTAGLDPKGRDDILDQIAELHKVRGITIILVSHSMEDIAKYAERLIVVNDGEIAYDDAPKAVFAHYRELEAMGLAAPQITYIMHALKEKGLDVDVTATTVDEAKENILAVLRKCNPGKLSGDKQSVSDSQSKKENAKAETLISEMEADLTEDGTYYPADSVLHKMDPRAKLVGTLVFIISVFVFHTFPGYAVATIFLAAMIILSKVPVKFMFKGLKAIVMLLMITVVFNIFLTPGKVLWQWGILHVTEEGLKLAGRMAIRLTYLVIGSSLMTLTTTPNQLTDGLERLLRPLNKLHVPIHEIAMMMSIALRFIPILMEETDKIMKAQIARGADFETGNIIQKAKNMIPLLVPLFISAFRRANDLAMAMEARCYHGGDNRTQMKPLRYESRDYISYVVMWAYLGIAIVFRIVGI